MKISIELNLPDDRMFLNFWDSVYGNDIVAQIIEGRIYLRTFVDGQEEPEVREVPFMEYIELVVESALKQPNWKPPSER